MRENRIEATEIRDVAYGALLEKAGRFVDWLPVRLSQWLYVIPPLLTRKPARGFVRLRETFPIRATCTNANLAQTADLCADA
jgi:hypothetical protein